MRKSQIKAGHTPDHPYYSLYCHAGKKKDLNPQYLSTVSQSEGKKVQPSQTSQQKIAVNIWP